MVVVGAAVVRSVVVAPPNPMHRHVAHPLASRSYRGTSFARQSQRGDVGHSARKVVVTGCRVDGEDVVVGAENSVVVLAGSSGTQVQIVQPSASW